MSEDKTVCPHCGQKMQKFETPTDCSWAGTYWWVCFNDECPYYVRGWDHMWKTQKVKCSYRHRYDPETNSTGPMPVSDSYMGKTNVVE